ncbi:MAG TPA: FtsQ-type POTRA domain-containing protein [Gemmatimonadaceae bacterium]|nr:FtsQ-type POTRA domain-containing protein [Gemmatimonadaceae bacterium]
MSESRFSRPGWRILGILLLLGLVMAAAWGTRTGARKMAFFRVRAVEVKGARYLAPDEIVARLRVDTLASLWDDIEPLRRRLQGHPQISSVAISRRMPGTLVVTVEENLPVALVASPKGLLPYDSLGKALPIDPTRRSLDLPLVATGDPVLLKLVGAIRAQEPELFARVEEVRRTGRQEIELTLAGIMTQPETGTDTVAPVRTPNLRVRALTGLSVTRLADIFPVESDLARRHLRAEELDLRYRDQVIARLQ